MNGFRSFLYSLARLLGDINALLKGKIATRLIYRASARTLNGRLRKMLSN